jgi:voltage-gated sodium channel
MADGSAGAGQGWRHRLGIWIESVAVQRAVIAVIVINAIILGMETSATLRQSIGPTMKLIDHLALAIFVVELSLKLIAFGPRFFRSAWNVFDFIVVGIALIPASGPLAVLRALRVLRVLRLISVVPQLRFVVEALLSALPGIAAIGGLMALVYYVFAVVATGLFGADFNEWFGTLGRSLYSLFQIMTLESWSMGIVRPVMQEFPHAWMFFVPFILIATFTMLNLFIAVIVNTMQNLHEHEKVETIEIVRLATHEETASLEAEVRAMRGELVRLRQAIESSSSAKIDGS